MSDLHVASSVTLHRISVYLRCLRELQTEGLTTISSLRFAERFHLSSAQVRKDLAQFGDFGIRGVGYEIDGLAERLHSLLGLDRKHRLVIVGMGNLGCALAGYVGFNDSSFEVVAAIDNSPEKIGRRLGELEIRDVADLAGMVSETAAEIGVLTVPATSAVASYEALRAAGIRSILNFAPVHLPEDPGVTLKNVDLRVYLEEASFLLQTLSLPAEEAQ